MKITVTKECCREGLKKYMYFKYMQQVSVHGVADAEARDRSSLSIGDVGVFAGCFYSS